VVLEILARVASWCGGCPEQEGLVIVLLSMTQIFDPTPYDHRINTFYALRELMGAIRCWHCYWIHHLCEAIVVFAWLPYAE